MAYRVRFANPQQQYQDHRDEFIAAFDDVLSRGDIVLRKDLAQFEESFAQFVGTRYAIGVNSGTSAIWLGMRAAGIGAGDEVITVAHTFIASISIPYLLGAKPVLIDVGKDFNINPALIEQALTKRTKAIEPVHLNGRCCDMEPILDIAKRKGLLVIEDAAQALGAGLQLHDGTWKKAGSFGAAGAFSLYWAKTLGGFGNNGVVTTDDPEVAEKVRLMRYNGEDRETRHFKYHSHNLIMDNLHAALLNVKFKYFPSWLERRRAIAERYRQGLSGFPELALPHFDHPRFHDTYTNYVVRTPRRDELKAHLEREGVETIISWPVPTYREELLLPNDIHLPETERICTEVLSLPMYPELTDEQVDLVIAAVTKFYRG